MAPEPHRHFLLHKPYGYLSQFRSEAKKEQKKRFLGELHDFPPGLMAIGRLDEDSEGLLLLTTDGRLSEAIRSRHVEKEYHAQLDGLITDAALARLAAGVIVGTGPDAYRTAPARAVRLLSAPDFAPRSRPVRADRHRPSSWVSLVLGEGKFRQVRRMTAAVGFPTLRLVRVRVGGIWLEALPVGAAVEVEGFGLAWADKTPAEAVILAVPPHAAGPTIKNTQFPFAAVTLQPSNGLPGTGRIGTGTTSSA